MKIYKNYPIGKYTTFKAGGNAQFYCEPENISEVKEYLIYARENNLKHFIFGGGANLLIADCGFKGLVISTNKLKFLIKTDDKVNVGSGFNIDKLNKKLISFSLSGMEFSGGLPGSIGGAIYMNARAYGHEFSEVVESVTVLDENFDEKILNKSSLNYSYKNSIFMEKKNLFIVSAMLALKHGNKNEIKDSYKNNRLDRITKGQFDYPSAGCIFKNDYSLNIPTGKIIEDLGLKGKTIGGAEVSLKHANFIFNKKNASSKDILALIEYVEKKVFEEKGIKLEREVRLVGF
jgi:UDP-N-acetylmuramate dehydrogenase